MSEYNNVLDRVFIDGKCDNVVLKSLALNNRSLIVCDCEGYELELFTDDVIKSLSQCSLIIEVHDIIDITISSILKQRFCGTHKIQVIESIDDIKKAKNYQYRELENYSLAQRKLLFAEYRGAIMEWFYLTPLSG